MIHQKVILVQQTLLNKNTEKLKTKVTVKEQLHEIKNVRELSSVSSPALSLSLCLSSLSSLKAKIHYMINHI